jgi:hypothetical protein
MNIKIGNLMDKLAAYDQVFVTTNSTIKTNGDLVMGRGFAKSLADKLPFLASNAGKAIMRSQGCKISGWDGFPLNYGIIPYVAGSTNAYAIEEVFVIGLFQVKHHWGEPAKQYLVEMATEMLNAFATHHHHMTFAVNFPAIGNGNLNYDDIYPIINELPDNVDVWQLPRPIKGYTSITTKTS